jgi:hypothetical protein
LGSRARNAVCNSNLSAQSHSFVWLSSGCVARIKSNTERSKRRCNTTRMRCCAGNGKPTDLICVESSAGTKSAHSSFLLRVILAKLEVRQSSVHEANKSNIHLKESVGAHLRGTWDDLMTTSIRTHGLRVIPSSTGEMWNKSQYSGFEICSAAYTVVRVFGWQDGHLGNDAPAKPAPLH